MADNYPGNQGTAIPSATASLSDILTVQKNGVIAIGNLNQNLQTLNQALKNSIGTNTVIAPKATTTLVRTGTGYVSSANVNLIPAGTPGVIFIFDCVATSGAAPIGPDTTNYTNCIVQLPATIGNYKINAYYSNGLVIKVGNDMLAIVTYSIIT